MSGENDPKDQEAQTPSHGFDAVKWEGVGAAAKDSRGQEAEADSSLARRLLQVVEATDLIASQKLILTVILYHLIGKESCELKYEDIMAHTSLSKRVVTRYLPELENRGWIKRTKKAHSYIYEYIK